MEERALLSEIAKPHRNAGLTDEKNRRLADFVNGNRLFVIGHEGRASAHQRNGSSGGRVPRSAAAQIGLLGTSGNALDRLIVLEMQRVVGRIRKDVAA